MPCFHFFPVVKDKCLASCIRRKHLFYPFTFLPFYFSLFNVRYDVPQLLYHLGVHHAFLYDYEYGVVAGDGAYN